MAATASINSPLASQVHFQKRMSQILAGLDGVLVLIDDILVFRKDLEEHDARLEAVLQQDSKRHTQPEFSKPHITFLAPTWDTPRS